MDFDYEKERLLDLVQVSYLCDEELSIKLDNIDLDIEKNINGVGHNLTIISNVKMDSNELEKYDKCNSEININYTLYDEEYSNIELDSTSIYFDGGVFESEFTGEKTIRHQFFNLNLNDIEEILIEIDAYLYEKNDADDKVEILITFDQEKFENELQKLGFKKHN